MENELTKLMVVEGMMKAQIIKSKLDHFEIPCLLKYDSAANLFGLTVDGLGKVAIMVHQEHLKQARELIDIPEDS